MKTVLITGSAGCIGTNLTKKLLEGNYYVIGIDNFYSSSPKNVGIFKNNPKYRFIKHDVRKQIKFLGKLDEIYNLASPASVPFITKNPIFTLETSVLGITNMAKLAKLKGAKLLQASTSEAYGDPLEHPQQEDYRGNVNTVGPRACYDEGKRAAETICYEFFNQGVDVHIVRIFNTCGPYTNPEDGRVLTNLIVQALKDKDLTVYGNGYQTRSFCYVDDLLAGFIAFMNLKKRYLGPINIGNPREITILRLAEIIKKLIPESKSKIVFKPLPKDDPEKRKPDISRAKEVLGWKPKVGLEEGIKKIIEYLRTQV